MQTMVQVLVQTTVSMSAVAILVLLLLPLLSGRLHPKGIYYSLCILLLGFLIPFRPMLREPALTVPLPSMALPGGNRLPETNLGPQAMPSADAVAGGGSSISPMQILFLVWIIGTALALTCYMVQHIRFMRTVKRWGKTVTDPSFLQILAEEKQALGIRREIALLVCAPVGTPMLAGFFRPAILLPDLQLSESERRLVIRHELVHHRRGDLWAKALLMAVLVVHWFNPLVYLLARSFGFYCEASCDAEVVKDTGLDDRQYYSETIIGVIRRQASPRTALSTSFYGGKNGMKRRIRSIMDMKRKGFGIAVTCCVLLITLGTGMAFAVGSGGTDALAGIDLTGRSEDYRLMAQMAQLDQNMSVAEYQRQVHTICRDNGKEFFSLVADVADELDTDDPLYPYYINTISHTSSELFTDRMGGEEITHSFGYAQRSSYGPDPVREEHYSDAEWAFVQEVGPDIIYFVGASYVLYYEIPDTTAITVNEREGILSAAKNDVQAFLDGMDEDQLFGDDLRERIAAELERVSRKHSNDRMILESELSMMDYIGGPWGLD